MSNFGYFQLKAAPGMWSLRLMDGKASQLYSVADAALLPSVRELPAQTTVIDSFGGYDHCLCLCVLFSDRFVTDRLSSFEWRVAKARKTFRC